MSHSGENNVDIMLGEDVDMMEGENVVMMEEEVLLAQVEKRKRGPTMCTKTNEQKELTIRFWKDGCPRGPNRSKYSNWCSNMAKQRASILVDSWDKFDKKTVKEEWWRIVKVKYLTIQFFILIIVHELTCSNFVVKQTQWNIKDDNPKSMAKAKTLRIMNEGCKQFKCRLVNKYMDKEGITPVGEYPWVTQEVWEEFQALKRTEEFRVYKFSQLISFCTFSICTYLP